MVHSKQRVLFLCTGNSCRSQMAEGWLRSLYGERFESLSAGVDPTGEVNPRAVLAMDESGIDISRQRSQDIAEYLPPTGLLPDLVISVCSSADRSCPAFPRRGRTLALAFRRPPRSGGG